VRDVANTSGTVIDHVAYDSYGNVTSETNATSGDRFKYAGREYDAALGLYYNRARYYDPASGRFVGQDPSKFGGGDSNLYRYVGNDPVNLVDSSGKLAQKAQKIGAPIPIEIVKIGILSDQCKALAEELAHLEADQQSVNIIGSSLTFLYLFVMPAMSLVTAGLTGIINGDIQAQINQVRSELRACESERDRLQAEWDQGKLNR
jgi:RHS repeat-associated protein